MTAWSETWRRAAINLLLPVTRPDVVTCLRSFRRLESASPRVVDEYQRLQLLDLLRHCQANVPYYRRQLESANLDLSESFSVEDLSRLPILTKDIIRREGENLHSRDARVRGAFENSSGGSTGRPVVFLQDKSFYVSNVIVAKFIYNRILGKNPAAAEVNLWGSERRENIEKAFGCPVFNQYGSREFGAIAFEMHDQNGMRGFPYLNYTEIVDGKVVITCLTNYSMPFLRYEIGDTAEPWNGADDETYGCRRKLFQTITGRVHSHFKTARGDLVHGLFFTHQFYFLDWVRQFQIVQESVSHISCYLALADEPVTIDMDRIRSRICDAMGGQCGVEFQFVDRILPAASGKHLYTISKVE